MSGTTGFVRQVGLRHLVRHRLRSTLTVGGIAAGVALLFAITTMNASLVETIRASATAFDTTADVQVTAVSPGGLAETVSEDVAAVDDVRRVAPLLQVRTTVTGPGEERDAFVVGATGELAALQEDVTVRTGDEPAAAAGATSMVIGPSLAEALGVHPGDVVSVATPRGPQDVHVAGIVVSDALDRVNGGLVAMMDLETAQAVFGRPGRIDLVLVQAEPNADIDAVTGAVERAVGPAGFITEPGAAPGTSSADIEPFVMLTNAVGMIALFVALVLVFNTMSMAVAERRVEHALARTLGATPRQLRRATLLEAAVLGLVGSVAGVAAGAGLAHVFIGLAADTYRSLLPITPPTSVAIRPVPLVLSLAGGIGATVAGAVLPSRRALKAQPIDALRRSAPYEWSDPGTSGRAFLGAGLGLVLVLVGGILVALGADGLESSLVGGAYLVMLLAGITLLLPVAVPVGTRAVARLVSTGGVSGRLAGDALRTNPRRTSATVATLLLPLAMVVGMGTAFESAEMKMRDLAEQFVSTPFVAYADTYLGYTATQPLPEAVAAELESVDGVQAALPDQNTFVLVDGEQSILYVASFAEAERRGLGDALHGDDAADDPPEFRRRLLAGQIGISERASRALGVDEGDTIEMPTPSGPATFTVAGTFDTLAGVNAYYLDRDTYVRHWGDRGSFRIGLVTDPGIPADVMAARLRDRIEEAGLPVRLVDGGSAVDELAAEATNIFSIARTIQFAALLVAALSIAATAFTVMLERRWLVALQRTLGMSRRQVGRSLGVEATAIGVIGAVGAIATGLVLGALMCIAFGAAAVTDIPIRIPWSLLPPVAFLGILIAVTASAQPRRSAGRLPIVAALRTD